MKSTTAVMKASGRSRLVHLSWLAVLSVVGLTALAVPAYAEHGDGLGISYPVLDEGFTQDLVGTASGFMGDIVFATDGDIFVSPCVFQNGSLRRFDLQTAAPVVNGTNTLHPVTTVASNAGCGMINHPDGFIYSNTSAGIAQINATTGAATGVLFGAAGNALGIAVNPDGTGDIMHMGASNGPVFRTPVGGASVAFSNAHANSFVDEITYDTTGLLWLATRTGGFRLTVVNPDGTLNRLIPLPSEPDGMAFHATLNFMITMNTNGTITKIDLGAGDAISAFASGGFRHDMSTVGADGCVYNTQSGTRFDNGTLSGNNSVVRICGGFAPQLSNPIDVEKRWTETDVCFERDNDGDGQVSEDGPDGVDNDLDGLIDEDPSECLGGTSPGTPLENDDDETFFVDSVLRKNGSVSSYNPGQLYAVTTVNILQDTEQLNITEDYVDCTEGNGDLLDLNPKKGGGRAVVVVEHADGTLEQVFDANTDDPNVVFNSVEGGTMVWWSNSFSAGDIVHLYVKFGPGKNSSGDGICENWEEVSVFINDEPFFAEAHAVLVVTPKPKGN